MFYSDGRLPMNNRKYQMTTHTMSYGNFSLKYSFVPKYLNKNSVL